MSTNALHRQQQRRVFATIGTRVATTRLMWAKHTNRCWRKAKPPRTPFYVCHSAQSASEQYRKGAAHGVCLCKDMRLKGVRGRENAYERHTIRARSWRFEIFRVRQRCWRLKIQFIPYRLWIWAVALLTLLFGVFGGRCIAADRTKGVRRSNEYRKATAVEGFMWALRAQFLGWVALCTICGSGFWTHRFSVEFIRHCWSLRRVRAVFLCCPPDARAAMEEWAI